MLSLLEGAAGVESDHLVDLDRSRIARNQWNRRMRARQRALKPAYIQRGWKATVPGATQERRASSSSTSRYCC